MSVNENREEKRSVWNLSRGTQEQEREAAVGPCWGPACTGLAPEDSGCQGMAGPSLAGAANDAGQGSVIYVPWLGDKEKGTFTSS